jgi:hypothetical protein
MTLVTFSKQAYARSMTFFEKLRNRWEARRRERKREEAEKDAAALRGEVHTLREQKDAWRELSPREHTRIRRP